MSLGNNLTAPAALPRHGVTTTTSDEARTASSIALAGRPGSPPPFSHNLPDYRTQRPLPFKGTSTFQPFLREMSSRASQQAVEALTPAELRARSAAVAHEQAQAQAKALSDRLVEVAPQAAQPNLHQLLGALTTEIRIDVKIGRYYRDVMQGTLDRITDPSARARAREVLDYVSVLCDLCEAFDVPGVDSPVSLCDEMQALSKPYDYYFSVATGTRRPDIALHGYENFDPEVKQAQHYCVSLMERKNVLTKAVAQALRARIDTDDVEAKARDRVSVQLAERLVRAKELHPDDPRLADVCVSRNAEGGTAIYFQSRPDFNRRATAELSLHMRNFYSEMQIGVRQGDAWVYDQATKHAIIEAKLSQFEM